MPAHTPIRGARNVVDRGELRSAYRGLHLRTHPDADLAASRVWIHRIDEVVLDNGLRVADWDRIAVNIGGSGANGLDTGAEAADTWYEVYGIYKPAGGVKAGILHRAKDYFEDETSTAGEDGTHELREGAATNIKLSQGFQVDTAGEVEFVDVKLIGAGSPVGNFWFTIEGNAAGVPDDTPLATSDKIDASLLSPTATTIRVAFRTPASLTAATQYHLVLQGDYAVSATDNIGWRADTSAGAYANGSKAAYDGTSWAADADDDFIFKVYVARNDAAVTMPAGYEGKALLGYVRNDGSSNFVRFLQRDRRSRFLDKQNVLDDGAALVETLVDVAAAVPPGALDFLTYAQVKFNAGTERPLHVRTEFGRDYMNVIEANAAFYSAQWALPHNGHQWWSYLWDAAPGTGFDVDVLGFEV